eukprot:149192_1
MPVLVGSLNSLTDSVPTPSANILGEAVGMVPPRPYSFVEPTQSSIGEEGVISGIVSSSSIVPPLESPPAVQSSSSPGTAPPANSCSSSRTDAKQPLTSIQGLIQDRKTRERNKASRKLTVRSVKRRKRGPEPVNSALFFYRMEVLESVAGKFSDASPVQIVEIIERQWESLSEEEREKYHKMAEQDRERFNAEVKQFLPKSEGGTLKRIKRKKHPNAPKHPMSAYLYFVGSTRQKLKEDNPGKDFTAVAKMLGENWKRLSTEDRREFVEKAEKDKKRYRDEKAVFDPSPEYADEESLALRKRKKHPLAPKHPLSGYLYFVANNRAEYNKKNPGKDFTSVAKILGEQWKSLGHKDRRKYEILAAADKKRYEEEKERWQPPMDDRVDEEQVRLPKKPITAYSFWAIDERSKVLQEFPNIDKRELTRQLRAKWNQLPEENKKIFMEQAEQDRIRYEQELSLIPKQYRPKSNLRRQKRQERLMRVPQEVLEWSPEDVRRFVQAVGLSDEIGERFQHVSVSGHTFVQLTSGKLRDQLGIVNVVDRKRICRAIWLLSA